LQVLEEIAILGKSRADALLHAHWATLIG